VLVELGYLSNPQDVANLTSPDWRDKTAGAMTEAVRRFFAPAEGARGGSEKPAEALAVSGKPAPEDPSKHPAAPPP
jgi:N-acetylmuramoyl-L-alanine amidase